MGMFFGLVLFGCCIRDGSLSFGIVIGICFGDIEIGFWVVREFWVEDWRIGLVVGFWVLVGWFWVVIEILIFGGGGVFEFDIVGGVFNFDNGIDDFLGIIFLKVFL